jgi:hypothetical protein
LSYPNLTVIATDLKPSSIHITHCNADTHRSAYSKPVIGDLSQTKILGVDTTTDITGTVCLQAPEQIGRGLPFTNEQISS